MNIPTHLHHRRSIRLKGYDYSLAGAYFITIVTYKGEDIFGEIVDNESRLNQYGEIAKSEWFNTARLRPSVSLYPDEMVVMPNHIHGIMWINQSHDVRGAATLRPYPQSNGKLQNVAKNSLGAMVRGYKSAVTYRINAIRNSRGISVWQRNYYDHIIRDEDELRKIWDYIDTNPQNWIEDRLHLSQ